jgi:hypothetical protein
MFIICLLINFIIANAQVIKTDESVIVANKIKIVNSIRNAINSGDTNIKFGKNTTVIAVPFCYLDLQKQSNGFGYDWNYLTIDTLEAYAIFKNRNEIIGRADKLFIPQYTIVFEAVRFGQSLKQMKMIEFALEYTKNPFFVYFLKDEIGFRDVIGYFNKGRVSYIDESLHRYATTQEIITSRYGCLQKYVELVDDYNKKQKLLTSLKSANLEDVKNIIRNDYLDWSLEFPADTAKILDLFMSEIDRISLLTSEQHLLLKNKVIKTISVKFPMPFSCLRVPFLHSELYYDLRSVLTKNQLSRYLEQRELNLWVASRAKDIIFGNLKKFKANPGESPKDIYKREVFGKQ